MPRGVASDSCSSTYVVRVRAHGRRRQQRRPTTLHDKWPGSRPLHGRRQNYMGGGRSSGSSISEAQRDSRVQRSFMPDIHTCWKLWKPACIAWKSRTSWNILDLLQERSGRRRTAREEQRQSRRRGARRKRPGTQQQQNTLSYRPATAKYPHGYPWVFSAKYPYISCQCPANIVVDIVGQCWEDVGSCPKAHPSPPLFWFRNLFLKKK